MTEQGLPSLQSMVHGRLQQTKSCDTARAIATVHSSRSTRTHTALYKGESWRAYIGRGGGGAGPSRRCGGDTQLSMTRATTMSDSSGRNIAGGTSSYNAWGVGGARGGAVSGAATVRASSLHSRPRAVTPIAKGAAWPCWWPLWSWRCW